MGDELAIKSLFIDDLLQIAIATKLPAMKRAGKAVGGAAIYLANTIAAMRAGVVEGLDRIILLTNDQELLMSVLVQRVVAGFDDIRRRRRQQPDMRPQVLPFFLHEFGRVIAGRVQHVETVVDTRRVTLQ